MRLLNIVTSPRKEKSASTAIVNAFLAEYRAHVRDVTVDRLDVWQEQLPEFDAEAINAKYKGVSGELMTPETPLYLALIASASNSGSCSCQTSNLSTVTSRTCALYSARNALTIAVDADFSFRGECNVQETYFGWPFR